MAVPAAVQALQELCDSAALLVVIAGFAKLRSPDPAATMIRTLWPRIASAVAPRRTVQLVAAGEIGVGLAVLLVAERITAALLALCYVIFVGVSARVAASRGTVSCGCFGESEPAGGTSGAGQLMVDIVCLAVATSTAVRPGRSALSVLGDGTLSSVVGAGQVCLITALGYLAIVRLPELTRARRRLDAVRGDPR
jgi:hypothetical protein